MKTIKIQELRDLVAGKLGLTCKAEDFGNFREFIDDIYSQFGLRWKTLDDQAYYWHNANMCDRHIEGDTSFIKLAYEDMEKALKLKEADAECYDESFEDAFSNPYGIQTEKTYISYVDCEGVSIKKMLEELQVPAKKYNGEFSVKIGELGNDECYCNLRMIWKVTADRIEPNDCYIEVEDDGHGRLMDALYWICTCFWCDTFEDFENLNVELHYYTSDKAEGLACEE